MHIIDIQIQAFNNKDLEAFLDCFAEDIKVFMLETNQMLTDGKVQLAKTMRQAFEGNSKAKTKIMTQIEQGDLIINKEHISDHIEGKIVKSISIYQIKENKIDKLWFGGRTIE